MGLQDDCGLEGGDTYMNVVLGHESFFPSDVEVVSVSDGIFSCPGV